jgi:hypothetical protein
MKKMTTAILLLLVFVAGSVWAYEIAHPNLKEAYERVGEAMDHLHKAYEANGDRGAPFGGHLETAEDFLKKARQEIIQADRYRDEHMRK